jgi:hypothetical protein
MSMTLARDVIPDGYEPYVLIGCLIILGIILYWDRHRSGKGRKR